MDTSLSYTYISRLDEDAVPSTKIKVWVGKKTGHSMPWKT